MIQRFTILFIGMLFYLAVAVAQENPAYSLIPYPVKLVEKQGSFLLTPQTEVQVRDAAYAETVRSITTRLREATGFSLEQRISHRPKKNMLVFMLDTSIVHREGYELDIRPRHIFVKARSEAGWFYAVETLMQLLPPSVEQTGSVTKLAHYTLPCVDVQDYPRFEWRGLMVDVSRHFFSKEVLKNYIDQMSKYKLNTLHLHLTDNQGWRIEIESLPRLTEIGAWRVPRTGYWKGFKAPQPGEEATYGGYYSKADIKELVAYAKSKCVDIVPEVDVPGHSLAFIASYPELSCTKTPQQVLAGDPWNPSRTNVLCVGNDSVYHYLDLIIGELAEMFPSPYIHIGGDEVTRDYWQKCPTCQKRMQYAGLADEEELQSYFLKRVVDIVESKGKKAIGWYENLKGGMAPSSIAMSWKSYEGGIKSSQLGQQVIMTPAFFTYLDFYQGDPLMENGPFTVARFNQFYKFEPIQKGVREELVLGGQGSLWTEQVPNERKLQDMTWPRSLALAEILWSTQERRPWPLFVKNVEHHFERFDAAHIKYSTDFYEPIVRAQKEGDTYKVVVTTEVEHIDVYYSFDDTSPDNFYPRYEGQAVAIPEGAHHIRLISYKDGKPVGRELNLPLSEVIKRL